MRKLTKIALSLVIALSTLLLPNEVNADPIVADGFYVYVGDSWGANSLSDLIDNKTNPSTLTITNDNKANFLKSYSIKYKTPKNLIFCNVSNNEATPIQINRGQVTTGFSDTGDGMDIDGTSYVHTFTPAIPNGYRNVTYDSQTINITTEYIRLYADANKTVKYTNGSNISSLTNNAKIYFYKDAAYSDYALTIKREAGETETLTSGTDYTVNGNEITIINLVKTYNFNLEFHFTKGQDDVKISLHHNGTGGQQDQGPGIHFFTDSARTDGIANNADFSGRIGTGDTFTLYFSKEQRCANFTLNSIGTKTDTETLLTTGFTIDNTNNTVTLNKPTVTYQFFYVMHFSDGNGHSDDIYLSYGQPGGGDNDRPEIWLVASEEEDDPENSIQNITSYPDNSSFYILKANNYLNWELVKVQRERGSYEDLELGYDYAYDSANRKITIYEIAAESNYGLCLTFADPNDSSKTGVISVRHNGNKGNEQPGTGGGTGLVGYDNYYYGLVDVDTSSTAKLFLEDYIGFEKSDKVISTTRVLMATTARGDSQAAPEDIYNNIIDVNVSFDTERSTIDQNKVTITKRNSKVSYFNRDCFAYDISFAANAVGKLTLLTTFKIKTGPGENDFVEKTAIQSIETIAYNPLVVNLTATEMVESKFNDIFSSLNNLAKFMGENIFTMKTYNAIEVNLPAGTYEGNYKIQMEKFIDDGSVYNTFTVNGAMESGQRKTTINGTIELNGGIIDILNINFVASNNVLLSDSELGITNKTIAIIARTIQNTRRADIQCVDNCAFVNYDYGLITTNTGLISSVANSDFFDCAYGYYMDAKGTEYYTGGPKCFFNRFVNLKNAAVAIISTPSNMPSYSWRFNYNEFYVESNDKNYVDFYIEQDGSANDQAYYYFMFNYYGTKSLEYTNQNIRRARIGYDGTRNALVVTNPCIKYPKTDFTNWYNTYSNVSSNWWQSKNGNLYYPSVTSYIYPGVPATNKIYPGKNTATQDLEAMMGNPDNPITSYELGIDDTKAAQGQKDEYLYTAFISGTKVVINSKDKKRLEKATIASQNGKDQLGGIRWQ